MKIIHLDIESVKGPANPFVSDEGQVDPDKTRFVQNIGYPLPTWWFLGWPSKSVTTIVRFFCRKEDG